MEEIIQISAGGLGVRFWRDVDRYRHEITVATSAGPRVFLTSIEGAAVDAWPPSPALQELHLERRPEEKQVALLVGRAGRAHWSLSVEVDAARETLLFDAACRSHCAAEQLRSGYHLSDGCRPDAGRLLLSRYELCPLEGDMHLDLAAGFRVSFGPSAAAPAADKARTFRWQYRLGPA